MRYVRNVDAQAPSARILVDRFERKCIVEVAGVYGVDCENAAIAQIAVPFRQRSRRIHAYILRLR